MLFLSTDCDTTTTDAGLFKAAFTSAQETNKSLVSNTAAPAEDAAVIETVEPTAVESKEPLAVEEKKETESVPVSLSILIIIIAHTLIY